jgi:hypothetical protein
MQLVQPSILSESDVFPAPRRRRFRLYPERLLNDAARKQSTKNIMDWKENNRTLYSSGGGA